MKHLTTAAVILGLAACAAPAPTLSAPDPSGKAPPTSTVTPEQAMGAPKPAARAAKPKIAVPFLGIDSSKTAEGMLIKEMTSNSPAAKAGLQPKDVILSVNGVSTPTPKELRSAIRNVGGGQPVLLRVKRNGGVIEQGDARHAPSGSGRRRRR